MSLGIANVSVLIPALNEEKNIAECLESVKDAGEVFLVDSGSTDRTCKIAESFGARVVQFEYDGGWPKKKNWALKNLDFANEWVLILDADERVTPALRAEIGSAINSNKADGYYIRWKFVFMGRWLKHGWGGAWMLRLFKHRLGRYENLGLTSEGGWDVEVHENVALDGRVGYLKSFLLHESRQNLSHWLAKHNDFSTWSAVRAFKKMKSGETERKLSVWEPAGWRRFWKRIFNVLPFRPFLCFAYFYFLRLGFLDGAAGYHYTRLKSQYIYWTELKKRELGRSKD